MAGPAILVVDDDKVDRLIVRRAIAGLHPDMRVDEAESVDAGRNCIERESYDCIFLDYNIPGGDGMAVLRFIRETGRATPVVILTGQGDEQLAVELMKAGATDYLSKGSLNPERLRQSFRNAVSLAEARGEAARQEGEIRALAERLRLAAEASHVGTWDYDPVADKTTWDDRTAMVLGATPGVQYDIAQIQALVHPDDGALVAAAREAALDPNGPGDFRVEYRARPSEEGERWIDARGRVLFEGEGDSRKAVRFIGTVIDITDRKKTEQALREEARVVETLQRIGGTLASEFKTDRIVQVVTDEATKLTNAQFGAFFYTVVGADGEAFTLYTISGVPREEFSKFPMPRNTAVFSPTFHGTEVVRSDDIRKDPRYGRIRRTTGCPRATFRS